MPIKRKWSLSKKIVWQNHKNLQYFTDQPNIYNKKKIVLTTKLLISQENIGVQGKFTLNAGGFYILNL